MADRHDSKRGETSHPNIFLYPHGVYYFRGHFNGTLVEKSLKTNQFAKAKERTKNLLNSLTDSDLIPGSMTCSFLWPKFMETKEEERDDGTLSEASFKEYQWMWTTYLEKHFLNIKMRDLSNKRKGPEHWREFKKKYRHLNMANMRKIFTAFLRWCQKEGHVSWVLPCEIPEYESRQGKSLTKEQQHELIQAASGNPNLFLFCLMYLLMAMRKSEITQAGWDQVNFKEDWILTKKKKSRTKPPRIVPLHPVVRELLEKRKSMSKSPFVFPHRDDNNKPMDRGGFRKAWARALEKAGLKDSDIQMHDLRRTWETEAQQRGDFTDIQREKFAGHSAKVAKERYTKFTADHIRPLVQVVEIEGLKGLIKRQESTWEKPGKSDSKRGRK